MKYIIDKNLNLFYCIRKDFFLLFQWKKSILLYLTVLIIFQLNLQGKPLLVCKYYELNGPFLIQNSCF